MAKISSIIMNGVQAGTNVQSALLNKNNIESLRTGANKIVLNGNPGAGEISLSSIKPEILFVADVVVKNEKKGKIIVFRDIPSINGYEIWRADLMSSTDRTMKKLIVLSVQTLLQDKARFENYIVAGLGINNLQNYLVYYDRDVPLMARYRLKALKFPDNINDFRFLDFIQLSSLSTTTPGLFDGPEAELENASEFLYGETNYAWVLALLNPALDYFSGPEALTAALGNLASINIPVSLDSVVSLILEAFRIFGAPVAIASLLQELGNIPSDIAASHISNIDNNQMLNKTNTDVALTNAQTKQEASSAVKTTITGKSPAPTSDKGTTTSDKGIITISSDKGITSNKETTTTSGKEIVSEVVLSDPTLIPKATEVGKATETVVDLKTMGGLTELFMSAKAAAVPGSDKTFQVAEGLNAPVGTFQVAEGLNAPAIDTGGSVKIAPVIATEPLDPNKSGGGK